MKAVAGKPDKMKAVSDRPPSSYPSFLSSLAFGPSTSSIAVFFRGGWSRIAGICHRRLGAKADEQCQRQQVTSVFVEDVLR